MWTGRWPSLNVAAPFVAEKTGSATQPGPPPVRGTWATWRRRSSSIPLSTPLWRSLFFWSCSHTIQVNLGSSWSARSPCRRRLTTVNNWRPSTTDDTFNAEPALTSAPAPTSAADDSSCAMMGGMVTASMEATGRKDVKRTSEMQSDLAGLFLSGMVSLFDLWRDKAGDLKKCCRYKPKGDKDGWCTDINQQNDWLLSSHVDFWRYPSRKLTRIRILKHTHRPARTHTQRRVRARARTHTHTHTHIHTRRHAYTQGALRCDEPCNRRRGQHQAWDQVDSCSRGKSGCLTRQVGAAGRDVWPMDMMPDRGLEVLPAPISALFWSLRYCTGWSSLSLSLFFSEEPVTSSLAAHQATRTQPKCCAKLLVYWAKEPPKVVDGHTTESGCLNFFPQWSAAFTGQVLCTLCVLLLRAVWVHWHDWMSE